MPIGEIETHPYLESAYLPTATGLILGSFPVYDCTNPDTSLKQQNRMGNGTVRFFYGSCRSSFWQFYQQYVDAAITPPWNADDILTSLKERSIAVSDLIVSCERYITKRNKRTNEVVVDPFSAEDAALHAMVWNRPLIQQIITNGATKILCTSKGVLTNLQSQIICREPLAFGEINQPESANLQAAFLAGITGDPDMIINPIAKVFNVQDQQIQTLTIPSPGSPQRQLSSFGYNGQQDWKVYLHRYLEQAFNWLQK